MVRGRQVGRPTAQAHYKRRPAHLFSLSVVPTIGMIDCEQSKAISLLLSEIASPDKSGSQ